MINLVKILCELPCYMGKLKISHFIEDNYPFILISGTKTDTRSSENIQLNIKK